MMQRMTRAMAVLLSAAGITAADEGVSLLSGIDGDIVVQQWQAGERLTVPLYLDAEGVPVFGGELELAVPTDDIRILSVGFDPALSTSLGEEAALPSGSFKATRVQPLGDIDRSLGSDGAPVLFATVGLEVLSDGPFESALIVKPRGALVGVIPDGTTVLGNSSGEDGWAVGQIEIINLADGAGDQATGEQVSWTVETGEAAIEIRPVGGGEAVTGSEKVSG